MADLRRIAIPVADLCDKPGGKRTRQFLFGEGFEVTEDLVDHVRGHRATDGYMGVLPKSALANLADPSHRIRDLGAHVYEAPDIKSKVLLHLPYQSVLTVIDETADFVEIAGGGFVHQMQIEIIALREQDYTRTAERYLGVPYLWGGNSQYGIDCSGLVAAALRSAGLPHPADSKDQEAELGQKLADDTPLTRGDLIFWKGHVGIMLNEDLLLHANGYHMKCVFEPLAEAATRIAAQGGGMITARKRL